jgi:hypothetical protein
MFSVGWFLNERLLIPYAKLWRRAFAYSLSATFTTRPHLDDHPRTPAAAVHDGERWRHRSHRLLQNNLLLSAKIGFALPAGERG